MTAVRPDIDGVGLTVAARRRIGSRHRMLAVGLRLIQEGKYRLSPSLITDAAKMHNRSFHAIFGDMPNYYEQLIEVHEASIRAAIAKAIAEGGRSLVRIVLLGE